MKTPKACRKVFGQIDKAAAAELGRWVRCAEEMRFASVAGVLYGWPAAQADAVRQLSEVLPVICSGVAMGQVFKGRLRPEPALAFYAELDRGALPVAEVSREEALDYLRRGEVRPDALAEGLNLICTQGRALGFAKRIGRRVNNMYPSALRILKP